MRLPLSHRGLNGDNYLAKPGFTLYRRSAMATAVPLTPDGGAQSPTLARVARGELCAGCGLCAGISDGAISMAIDGAGFARPQVIGVVSPMLERQIAAACPGVVVAPWPAPAPAAPAAPAAFPATDPPALPASDQSDAATGHLVHPYWGPILSSLTGHATDDAVRHVGSSGGMVSALAIYALDAGLVDAVVHVRADDADPLANMVTVSRSAADVLAAAGSRYGPSATLATVGALLDSDQRYMMVGKPCDVSALRQLAAVDSRVDARFVHMLSFFCGGMPSVKGTEAIVGAMGFERSDVAAFRYRGMGWPGTARVDTADGRSAQMSYEQSWGQYLSGRVQYRCKICPDAVGGGADIACADAWYGGESGYPQFDQRDGRSLVLVRTNAGRALLDAAIAAAACVVEVEPVAAIDLMQPAQARRKRLVRARLWAARITGQPVPVMAGLAVDAASARAGIGEKLRNFIGSVRRITQGRR